MTESDETTEVLFTDVQERTVRHLKANAYWSGFEAGRDSDLQPVIGFGNSMLMGFALSTGFAFGLVIGHWWWR